MPLPYLPEVTDAQLYELLNRAVLPAWALLALFPRSKLGGALVTLTALAMSAVYVALLYSAGQSEGAPSWADMQTLEGLSKAFSAAGALLPAWTHYLAHDLWVGKWLASDACNKRIPRLIMLPVLALAMLFGPAGPLVYVAAVRPLFGKAAVTPKQAKQPAAPAPAKQAQQKQQQQQPAGAAAPAPKNGASAKPAAKPAAEARKAQQQPMAAARAAARAEAAAAAATPALPKNGQVKNGSAAGRGAAPKPAPRPVLAPQLDIEDDRAFAEAAAALLRSRAQPKK